LDVRRISSAETAQTIGAEQIRHLAQAWRDYTEALDIVPADGKYGDAGFLRQVRGLRIGVITHLRRDRVLYQAPPQPTTRCLQSPLIFSPPPQRRTRRCGGGRRRGKSYRSQRFIHCRLATWRHAEQLQDLKSYNHEQYTLQACLHKFFPNGRDSAIASSPNAKWILRPPAGQASRSVLDQITRDMGLFLHLPAALVKNRGGCASRHLISSDAAADLHRGWAPFRQERGQYGQHPRCH